MADLSQILEQYQNEKIAIYGLGTETERLLNEIGREFQIIGLLDGYREDGILYDKPIIPLKYAIECQVKLIIVVARPGSCRAIFKRIGAVCMENKIAVIDVRGKDLCDLKKVSYYFKGADGISRECLVKHVDENDVVSIDLFDTLIMRQTLFPTDIFDIMECRLKEKGMIIKDFSGRRMASEKHLAKFKAPTLVEIYSYMKSTYLLPEMIPEELAELEWSIDYELALPRQEMCDFCDEIHEKGKEIYIVSDTFYTKEQLIKLLEKCNIKFYTDIFASCEYKTAKTEELFERVKDRISEKKCIHIGDDQVSDIESARKHGFSAYRICSGIDLLEMAGYLGLWDNMEGLSNRIKIGMFVSKLFNSPFQFENEEQKISVKSAYDIGYLLFAPMISDFVIWFEEQVQDYGISNVWLCARDGYLIKKMYDKLHGDKDSVYFLTSRTAAIGAGVENEEDIKYVREMKFSGTVEEELQERFGISLQAEMAPGDRKAGSLMDYSHTILSKAVVNRRNYHKYMEGLHIKEGDIAFFDFVAKGTSQMYIRKLVDNHLKGFYFLQLEKEYMQDKGLDILAFYDEKAAENSEIYENYYILETMLTSPMPSVREFDEQGRPCYAHETRKEEDILCMQEAQEGILDYFMAYMNICPKSEIKINRRIDEIFLSLIHSIDVLDKYFIGLTVEDQFFNRMTDVADLI
ncbi:MAG: HAD hydrolase-like protein [Lachnospiraceae bacterium]|nr:HAD hydrolase-like protein [Lachnospiraceae bacterium]